MIEFICDIGGYFDGYRHISPLAFNVKAWPDLDREDLWKRITEAPEEYDLSKWDVYPMEFYLEGESLEVVRYPKESFREAFYATWKKYGEYVTEWGFEEAREDVNDSDTWKTDTRTYLKDVQFGFYGRSGGWLCVERWNGWKFYGMSVSDLREALEEPDVNCDGTEAGFVVPFEEVRLMYRFCRVWSQDFTPESAKTNVEFYGTWRFARFLEDAIEERTQAFDSLPVSI